MKSKVLLIDDIREFCSLLKIMLSVNYDVVTAGDGEEALELLDDGYRPDVIITDLKMPRVDGFTLISILKNCPAFSDIPIIVLSNSDNPKNRIKLRDEGIYSFITKPYSAEELMEGLNRSLTGALSAIS